MKKICSFFLAFIIVFMISAVCFAENPAVISASFNSNLEGVNYTNVDKLVNLENGTLTISVDDILLCDNAQNLYFEAMKPGRTYYINYEFRTEDSTEFSEESDGTDFDFSCEGNTEIIYACYAESNEGITLLVTEKVIVDGNIFQRIIGAVSDWILKLRAWSLY